MKKFNDEDQYYNWRNGHEKRMCIYALTAFILLVSSFSAVVIYSRITVDYPYNKQIGAHLENTYAGSTPEIMKENLILAKEAMITAGLEPENYGKLFYWEQTPHYQMSYTYRYIDGLINRTDYIIEWRNLHINSGTPTFQDVYNEMITDLRTEYQHKDGIDYAARYAWILKYHGWAMYIGYATIVGVIITAVVMIYFLEKSENNDNPYDLQNYNQKHGIKMD